MKCLRQDLWSLNQELNLVSPEYEADRSADYLAVMLGWMVSCYLLVCLVQSGKTASGGCSAGPKFVRACSATDLFIFIIYFL
jgi:hypothetical protein